MTDADASTTHWPSAGKSILVICCCESCVDVTREKILNRPHVAPVHIPYRYKVQCRGEYIDLLPIRKLEHYLFSARYNEIYRCAHVYLTSHNSAVLQSRLTNPASWPGYFSKFP